jgi:hypothetical protein
MSKKKMCEKCGERPATVPDRARMLGRMVNRLCGVCHGERLAGDLRGVLAQHEVRETADRIRAAAATLTCWGLSSFCAEVGHKCRADGACVYAPPAP